MAILFESSRTFLSLSHRFSKFEYNTTSMRFSQSDVVLHSIPAEYRKIGRTRLRTFLKMGGEYMDVSWLLQSTMRRIKERRMGEKKPQKH